MTLSTALCYLLCPGVLGHLSQVVMSLLSRALQATVGLGHGHDFWEQEGVWLTWIS